MTNPGCAKKDSARTTHGRTPTLTLMAAVALLLMVPAPVEAGNGNGHGKGGGGGGANATPPAACGDGADNDDDGRTDFPEDPGCESVGDRDETAPLPVADVCNGPSASLWQALTPDAVYLITGCRSPGFCVTLIPSSDCSVRFIAETEEEAKTWAADSLPQGLP